MLNQDGFRIRKLNDGVRVPSWDKIISIVKENHLLIDNFDIVGWDFTVDDKDNPICFEYNIKSPGTILYQFTNGPLYGDKTEDVLSFLRDKQNQYNYIPCYMKPFRWGKKVC